MSRRWSFLLALLSVAGLGLLSYEVLPAQPSAIALTGLALLALTSFAYTLTLWRIRSAAFRVAVANYADRQIRADSRTVPTRFDARSAAL
jgi:hypothetical protein